MRQRTSGKLLSWLLVLCMVVGMLPAMSTTASAAGGAHGDHSDWTALTTDGGTLSTGSYYLNDDVTLNSNLTVSSGEVTLCLNGNILTGTGTGAVITVSNGATLNICDCTDGTTHGYIDADGLWKAGETVPDGGTECNLIGGVITGGKNSSSNIGGGGVQIGVAPFSTGTVNLSGGNIAGNTAESGGGVYICYSGKIDISGGTITGNTAKAGGGIMVTAGCTATISGGTIAGNTATIQGGGVYNYGSTSGNTFTISGGTISGNTAKYGGGVNNASTMNITGGTITGNIANDKGGGVYSTVGKLTLSGKVNISGNSKGNAANNLCLLSSDKFATVGSELASGSSVGVTLVSNTGIFAKPDGTSLTTLQDKASCFSSDSDLYKVEVVDGNLELKESAPPTITGVTVTPAEVSVGGGKTQQFTAEVNGTGAYSSEVTWSVDGAYYEDDTTIDQTTGLLSVYLREYAETLTVTAISKTDPTKSGTATVTVVPPLPYHDADNGHTPAHVEDEHCGGCWFPVTQDVIDNNNSNRGGLPNYNYHSLNQYYLTEDIVVKKSLTLSTGETLCLNGHSITLSDEAPEDTPVITVGFSNAYDGTVICDCQPNAHAENPTYGYWEQTGTQTINRVDEWDRPYQVTIPTYEYKLTKTLSEDSDKVMPHDTITGGYITGGKGGGIAIDPFNSDEETGVFVYNCTIAGNVNSKDGGGVAGGRKRLYLNNTQIVGNQSQDDGGGLYSDYTSTTHYYPSGVQINDGTVISHNIALDNGGGISATKAILNGDVKVEENRSLNGDGGGIFANGLEVAPGENKTVSISGNKAAVNGGGVAVDTTTTTALKLANAEIEDNEAGKNGGGVWLNVDFKESKGYSTVENCSVKNNTAGEFGGGLYINALSKENYYNFGAELTGTTVAQNTAKQGGGIYYWAHNYYTGDTSEQPLILKEGTTITKNKATQWGGGVVLENTRSRLVFDGGMVEGDNTLSDGTTVSTIGLSGAERGNDNIGYLPQLVFRDGFDKTSEITLGVSVAEGAFNRNGSNFYYYFYQSDLPDNVSIKNEGDYGVLSYHGRYDGYKTIFFTLPVPTVRLSGEFPSYVVLGNQGYGIPVTYQWNHMTKDTPVAVTDANADPYGASYADGVWNIVEPRLGPVGEDTSMCVALCDVFRIDLQAGESISFTTPKSLLDYLTVTFGEETRSIMPTLQGYDSEESIEFTHKVNGDSLIWTATAPESDEYGLRMVLFHDSGKGAQASAEELRNYVTNTLKLTDVKKVGYAFESKIDQIEGPAWEVGTRTYSESLFLKQMKKGEAYAADVTYKQPQKEKDKMTDDDWKNAQEATFRSAVIIANPLIYGAYAETDYQPDPYTVDLSAMYFFFDPIPGTEDVTVQYEDENREWVTKAENENLTLTKKPLSDILDEMFGETDEMFGETDENPFRTFLEQILIDHHKVQLPLDGTYDADNSYKLVITAADGDGTVYSTENMPYSPRLYINKAPSKLEDVDGGKIATGIAAEYQVTLPAGYTYTVQNSSVPDYVESATVSGNILTIVTTDGVTEGKPSLKLTASKKNYEDCTLTVNLTCVPKTVVTISGVTVSDDREYDGKGSAYSTAGLSIVTEDGAATGLTANDLTYTWQKKTEDTYENIPDNAAPVDAGEYRLVVAVKNENETYTGKTTVDFKIHYTVKFDSNGGTAVENDTITLYETNKKLEKPADPTKEGYIFLDWTIDKAGTTSWDFGNSQVTGNLTLYAQWKQTGFDITGNVLQEGATPEAEKTPVSGATVKAMKGNVEFGNAVTDENGSYKLVNVPAGTYNIIATSGGKTVTVLVTVGSNLEAPDIVLPNAKVSSELEVKLDTPNVMVGGLDEEAVANQDETNPTGVSVKITMTVEQKPEATASNASDIKTEAATKSYSEDNIVYLAIDLTKKVGSAAPAPHIETNNLLEIIVPFVTSDKHNFTVFRYHDSDGAGGDDGEVDTLTTTANEAGEWIEVGNNTITIHAKKFSTYAIAYTPGSAPIGGGDSGDDYIPTTYPVTVPDETPNGGKISISPKSASKGRTVTITVTPDDGYELDKLSVKDKNGKEITVTSKGNGKYTFIMPDGKVSISASFVKISDAPCGKENCPVGRFTDASVTAWYHDGVHYCVENGMMSGVSSNTFAPNANTSRAMIAMILWNLEGCPAVDNTLDFKDVAEGAWYTEAVRWAVSAGIISGYGNGIWGSNDDVTREQMVTILHNYAKYKGYDVSVGESTNILSYPDATQVAEYAIPAMQWACGSGIVSGTTAADGSLILAPKGSTTRAQMATMMMHFCVKVKE